MTGKTNKWSSFEDLQLFVELMFILFVLVWTRMSPDCILPFNDAEERLKHQQCINVTEKQPTISHPAALPHNTNPNANHPHRDFANWIENKNWGAFVNQDIFLGPAKSVVVAVATKMLILSDDKERGVRHKSLSLIFFNYEKRTAPREPRGLPWKRRCDADKTGARSSVYAPD